MVRETSQWEREEMEKVVSETKNLSLFGEGKKVWGGASCQVSTAMKMKQGKKIPFSLSHLGRLKKMSRSLRHIALESQA